MDIATMRISIPEYIKSIIEGWLGLEPPPPTTTTTTTTGGQGLEELIDRMPLLPPSWSPPFVTFVQVLEELRRPDSKRVIVSETSFTDDEWTSFCSLLSENKVIEQIGFHSKSLSVPRVKLLSRALSGSTNIQGLDFSYCESLPVEALCAGMATLSNLQQLILDDVHMTTQGAIALSKVLVNTTTIYNIDVAGNPNIGDEGCLAIIQALRGHRNLRELYMSNTGMTDDTVEAIATDLLPSLPSGGLGMLYLEDNPGIGNRGALALVRALRDDGSGNGVKVEKVWLRNCGITELHSEWLQCPKGMDVAVGENPIQTRLSVDLASAFLSHGVIRGLQYCYEFTQSNNIPIEYRDFTKDILRYITLGGDGSTHLSRGRIVLFGDYGQGKSWLARNISAEPDWFNQWSTQTSPPDLPSTQALDSFQVVVNNSTILVQDLGGQQVYRTVQSLLLHGSPLYMYCVSLADFVKSGDSRNQVFTQRLQLWLDTLASSHANEETQARVMLVATHADTVDDKTHLQSLLSTATSLFKEALQRRTENNNELCAPLILGDTSWAVDNRKSFRCWSLTGTGSFRSHDFPSFTSLVCETAMDCARQRYDPRRVPLRWMALYNLVRSKPGLRLEWKTLEQEAGQMDHPIKSADDLEFVLRLVREWTGIVYFRPQRSRHDVPARGERELSLAQQYIFLRPDWFVKVVSSLFIIHHHLAHDESRDLRDRFEVTIHTSFDGDFESDPREAPPLPAGVTLARLYRERDLYPLIKECTIERDLLVLLTKDARDELGMEDDTVAMDLLLATLEELDILIRVRDSTTERYLCPSLASTVTSNPSGMDEHVRKICESGLHREYNLPVGVPREIFSRIIAKMCRTLQETEGFVTTPVNLGYERALWEDIQDGSSALAHTLLLCWEQSVALDSPSLQVWTTGETAQAHPFLDCLESVLTSIGTLFPDKELQYPIFSCHTPSCRAIVGKNGVCDACRARYTGESMRYGPDSITPKGPLTPISSLPPGFVFVSYKWNPDSEQVPAKWVQQQLVPLLVQRVKSREIVYDFHPSSVQAQTTETKNEWMARMVREAAIVLVISSPGYFKSTKVTSGVRFEYVQILDRLQNPDKPVLPILPEGVAFEESVPLPLRAASIALQYPKQKDDLVSLLERPPVPV